MLGDDSMWLTSDVFVFENDFFRRIMQCKADDNHVYSRFAARFIRPAKGAVREVDFHALCEHPTPKRTDLFALGDAVGWNSGFLSAGAVAYSAWL